MSGYGNPDMGGNPHDESSEMVLWEISNVMGDMETQSMIPDYTENKADPKNLPGGDPSEPGVEFSDDDLDLLEGSLEPTAEVAPELAPEAVPEVALGG